MNTFSPDHWFHSHARPSTTCSWGSHPTILESLACPVGGCLSYRIGYPNYSPNMSTPTLHQHLPGWPNHQSPSFMIRTNIHDRISGTKYRYQYCFLVGFWSSLLSSGSCSTSDDNLMGITLQTSTRKRFRVSHNDHAILDSLVVYLTDNSSLSFESIWNYVHDDANKYVACWSDYNNLPQSVNR